ncbi:hypothetical protein D0Z00_002542 [Geotrichum galactomycetum]|uniref:Uncharacterized protein n=1 Tax=Geotrichum galactomycetum TaxID=27317 RepID=A0ACB6V3T8_9ASCO|nr:hypothetical protein D0Z00_002542 [Geotrichum candidum]
MEPSVLDVFQGLSTLELELLFSTDTFASGTSALSSLVLSSFSFSTGMTRQQHGEGGSVSRSIGLIGLGLAYNSVKAIDLAQVWTAAKGRHKQIVRRERVRERVERRASRGLTENLLSSTDEFPKRNEDEDDETAILEEEEEEEDQAIARAMLLTPKLLRLPGVLQRTGVVTLIYDTLVPTYGLSVSLDWALGVGLFALWGSLRYSESFKRWDRTIFGSHRLLYQGGSSDKTSNNAGLDGGDPEGIESIVAHLTIVWAGSKYSELVQTLDVNTFVLGVIGAGLVAGTALYNYKRRQASPMAASTTTQKDLTFFTGAIGNGILHDLFSQLLVSYTSASTAIASSIAAVGQRSIESFLWGTIILKLAREYPLLGSDSAKSTSISRSNSNETNSSSLSEVDLADANRSRTVWWWLQARVGSAPLVSCYVSMLVGGSVWLVKNGVRLIYY